jgi:hypothetical protein
MGNYNNLTVLLLLLLPLLPLLLLLLLSSNDEQRLCKEIPRSLHHKPTVYSSPHLLPLPLLLKSSEKPLVPINHSSRKPLPARTDNSPLPYVSAARADAAVSNADPNSTMAKDNSPGYGAVPVSKPAAVVLFARNFVTAKGTCYQNHSSAGADGVNAGLAARMPNVPHAAQPWRGVKVRLLCRGSVPGHPCRGLARGRRWRGQAHQMTSSVQMEQKVVVTVTTPTLLECAR